MIYSKNNNVIILLPHKNNQIPRPAANVANAIQLILTYYGENVREEVIIKLAKTTRKNGTPASGLKTVARKYNLDFWAGKMTIDDIEKYFDKNNPELINELKKYSQINQPTIYACQDGDGIVVNGDNLQFFGEILKIENGSIVSVK